MKELYSFSLLLRKELEELASPRSYQNHFLDYARINPKKRREMMRRDPFYEPAKAISGKEPDIDMLAQMHGFMSIEDIREFALKSGYNFCIHNVWNSISCIMNEGHNIRVHTINRVLYVRMLGREDIPFPNHPSRWEILKSKIKNEVRHLHKRALNYARKIRKSQNRII